MNSLWSARACFGDCIALLLSLFWKPSWPLWSTLGSLGAHFGIPVSPSGRPWDVSGQLWRFCVHRGPPSQADGSQVPRLRTKIDPPELASGSSRSRRNGPQTTVQTPRSTRAGDQNDVSFTNSLKLCITMHYCTYYVLLCITMHPNA